MMINYDFQTIEKKWQVIWAEKQINFCNLNDQTKPKFYNLAMFFYPSGAKIHIGHAYNYTGSDVYGRFKRMQGYNVFQPMGADAFGLPAENYALATGVHPAVSTEKNIQYAKQQLKNLGIMYDWQKEINTSLPSYYKWTQWLFGVLYKAGLAYQAQASVNWCVSCKTVLANEQVIDGRCERCHSNVIRKDLKQWFFRITAYADRLLEGHQKINWPAKTILMQKNWIGKSVGVKINFKIKNSDKILEVFTTRPDTLFGVTFMVIAPEHPLIQENQFQIKNFKQIQDYVKQAKEQSDLSRSDLNQNKTGLELKGLKIINPINNKEIPIFVADYILMNYGTGAIMGVPAHDQRDFEFAKKYNLEIIPVIKSKNLDLTEKAYLEIDDGEMINSGKFSGLKPEDCCKKIVFCLEEMKIGEKAINYRLHDWLISRQRYWGAPIPIIFCQRCGDILVPEKDLPVQLPDLEDFKPTEEGKSPLAKVEDFVKTNCPQCGGEACRSTETMDTFVCSSWYFLRFLKPDLPEKPFEKEKANQWLPVDQYCGGAEHACLHLLYARFITKVLYDQGYLDFDEPFLNLKHQGMILGADGTKMSKSKGDVVIPDDYIKQYGADVFRIYLLFLGPFEVGGSWSDRSILGTRRFLNRVFELGQKRVLKFGNNIRLEKIIHQTIKKITQDIENFKFNTAISALMILLNRLEEERELFLSDFFTFIQLLAPFAPHLAEELYQKYFKDSQESIFLTKWPQYHKAKIDDQFFNLVIQVNNKVRDIVKVKVNLSQLEIEEMVFNRLKIKKWTENKKIKQVIFIPNRLINIIVD